MVTEEEVDAAEKLRARSEYAAALALTQEMLARVEDGDTRMRLLFDVLYCSTRLCLDDVTNGAIAELEQMPEPRMSRFFVDFIQAMSHIAHGHYQQGLDLIEINLKSEFMGRDDFRVWKYKHLAYKGSALTANLQYKAESVPGRTSDPIVINTLDTQLAQSGLAALRIATLIGGVSAASGLLLSILGLLSAQNDAERQRQRDRALRIALGAQRWRIVLLVLKSAGKLAILGITIGTSLSFVLSRLLIAGIAAIGSPTLQIWLIVPILPAAAVILASMLPARRASLISLSAIMRVH